MILCAYLRGCRLFYLATLSVCYRKRGEVIIEELCVLIQPLGGQRRITFNAAVNHDDPVIWMLLHLNILLFLGVGEVGEIDLWVSDPWLLDLPDLHFRRGGSRQGQVGCSYCDGV